MAYTDIDKPEDYFNTKLYTGTGATQSITGVGFQPDLLWIRNRLNSGRTARAIDSVRGVGKLLNIAGSADEDTQADTVTSFDSDGFSLGADSSEYGVNDNTGSHVAWSWKAGTSFTNDASATGIGSIDSTGSVNTTAGFSIVKWTVGSAVNGLAVAHSLGVAPKIIIYKRTNSSSDWYVWLNKVIDSSQDYLVLNTTSAKADINSGTYGIPSSTLISNFGFANTEMIAYCFADTGNKFFKAGSYTGNGSTDGTFVYTGFKPAFLIIKKSSATEDWGLIDNKRDPNNDGASSQLFPNGSNAEDTSNDRADFLSNGFKLRTSSGQWNTSGGTYIYMCFASNPFTTSTGVPATAR